MALYQVQDPAIFNSTEIDKNNLQTAHCNTKTIPEKRSSFLWIHFKIEGLSGFSLFCRYPRPNKYDGKDSQQVQNGLPKNYDGIYQMLLKK